MELVDRFGRVATDLRVSLTDRCNLRCTYCMPAEGLAWMPRDEHLTSHEVVRLIGVASRFLGIRAVRFTGGEPLLRRELVEIIRDTRSLGQHLDLSITTNGVGLARLAEPLVEAGLNRVNVSLDSLRTADFQAMTRRDRLDDVLEGLSVAEGAGLGPIKVNAVLMRGINDDQASELLSWCLAKGYDLRFIEQMPLDAQHSWDRSTMVTADDILMTLRKDYDLIPLADGRGSAPAELYLVNGGPGTVGVIASVTRPFCGDCDRVRLTADGQIRTCLFARDESDLRSAMRSGATDEEIAARWVRAMWGKQAGHGIDDPGFIQPDRAMSAIGG